MRITFVLPHANLSGGTRVVAMYARKLTARGHSVCVISAPAPRPTLRDRARALIRGRILPREGPVEASHLDGLGIEHRVLDRQRPLVDADVPDADVIVATWWETALWIKGLSRSKGAGAYFIQHDETVFYRPEEVEGRRGVEASWHLPLHKFTVASWLADLGVQRGVAERIEVVPNAVDHDLFHAPPRGKQARPTVGLMYSTTSFKGCDTALAAIDLAREELGGLHLRAFGMDEPTSALPLPPGAEFVCRPEQSRLPDLYAACDAWLFSSRSEGFGLPILEAMACRTPVIGTPAGPAPVLLGAGGGILVRADDPRDMARAIARVARMPEGEWRSLSDAAYANAGRFTWDESATMLEATLDRAIARAAGHVRGGAA